MVDVPTLDRFGSAPDRPPPAVARELGVDGSTWCGSRVGHDGAFPNGGIWRYTAEGVDGAATSCVVKRVGPQFFGGNPIWANSSDPSHPTWWGREAAFYRSGLAARGWSADARVARCFGVYDGPAGTLEIWLEDLDIPALSIDVFRDVVRSLAHWQVATTGATDEFLSQGWIPAHLDRRHLDNEAAIADPRWDELLRRGIGSSLRDALTRRISHPQVAGDVLDKFPQMLTNYDLHHANIGRAKADGATAIIDWAYVGWGPIGQDVAHLALDTWDKLEPGATPQSVWDDLAATYTGALRDAGWTGSDDDVMQSMATAYAVRHGWAAEHLLEMATTLPDEAPSIAEHADFLAGLMRSIP